MHSPNYLALDWITYGKCIRYTLFSCMSCSLFHMKIWVELYMENVFDITYFPVCRTVFSIWKSLRVLRKAPMKIVAGPLYTSLFFFLYMHSLFFWKIKICSDRCFHQQIRLQTTVQWYIVRDYSSARIVFNIINKCHTLPIVYSMLVKIC